MASNSSQERANLPVKSGVEKNSYGISRDIEESISIEPRHVVADKLARKLSTRQVQMIAMLVNAIQTALFTTPCDKADKVHRGGTIGTGLFLGTGKSLATGGPASMLIAYIIVGFIVFLTMLSLGEMAAFMPIAGSFCTFAGRFVDDAFGFSITWCYWFNDAVSTAADLVALQLILEYWTTSDAFPGWALSLIFWVVLILANIVTVRMYGEVRSAPWFELPRC